MRLEQQERENSLIVEKENGLRDELQSKFNKTLEIYEKVQQTIRVKETEI